MLIVESGRDPFDAPGKRGLLPSYRADLGQDSALRDVNAR